MRESALERASVAYARRCGARLVKVRAGVAGFPDRILVAWRGQIVFMEFKTRQGRISKRQARWLIELRALGARCEVIRSGEQFRAILSGMGVTSESC